MRSQRRQLGRGEVARHVVELTRTARFLVRLAPEITRKSNRTRRRFQKKLVHNLADALRSAAADAKIQDRWSRIFVETSKPEAMNAAARVFGVGSFSKLDAVTPADLDAIVRTGREKYKDAVSGRRFAVAARRTGRQSFSSQDVRVELGAALNPYGVVDLSSPEVTVSVEVRDEEAYLFGSRTDGPGGLPAGVQGKAVCLISGGFDSAAAAWLMLKRGVTLDYVFCNLAGPAFERSVVQVAKVLADRWSYGCRPSIHLLDFGPVLAALQRQVTPRYWQVVLKRLMYRAAEHVARNTGAQAIVTGESLGQVSSQTLTNLRAIQAAAEMPVLRPLVGFDKGEIIRLAERIGTAALSARIKEHCAILEGKPVTAAKVRAVDAEEAPLDPELAAQAAATRSVCNLRALDAAELARDYVRTAGPPPDALVIDCRLPHQDDGWRFPGSRRVAPADFPEVAATLDKERRYLLFCDNEVQSTTFADLLQTAGYEAYSLAGGTKAMRERAREGVGP